MKLVKLQKRISIPISGNSELMLEYYLVETNLFHSSLYGIRIQSFHENYLSPIHEEEVSNLSYSRQQVNHLLSLCIQYEVTPTDLISALDTLMNL